MAGRYGRFKHARFRDQTASLAAGTHTSAASIGWGDFNQLTLRVEVATVTGGSDAYDCKLQTKMGNTWVDITGAAVTQMTGADTETVIVQRSEALSWGDEIRTVEVVAAGATVTLVDVFVLGAQSAGESTVTVGDITAVSTPTKSGTGTVAGVDDSATSVTLLAANTSREGVQVHNNSTSVMYIKYGGAASIASGGYTVQIPASGYWEMPGPSIYTGVLHAIWSANTAGYANVTELT